MVRTHLLSAAVLPFLAKLALAQSDDGPTVGSPSLYQCTPAGYAYSCECVTFSLLSPDPTKLGLRLFIYSLAPFHPFAFDSFPPCTVVIRPSGDETKSIDNLGSVDKNEGLVSWDVTSPEGDSVTAWITNSKGVTKSSAATVVAAGETDCSSSSSGSSASASASKASSGSSTSAGSASGSASSGGSASGTATSSSSAANASESADSEGGAAGLVAGSFLASAMAVAAYLA
ncbi:hypothetical protein JCM11641_001317 [Rhodosporidiobolus odoratus]